jgi:hypothetical protein
MAVCNFVLCLMVVVFKERDKRARGGGRRKMAPFFLFVGGLARPPEK